MKAVPVSDMNKSCNLVSLGRDGNMVSLRGPSCSFCKICFARFVISSDLKIVLSSAVNRESPLAAGKNNLTLIGGSVGAYRGCVGCLNGFSSVSRSFLIMDWTRPTTLTKNPRATARPTTMTISEILMCLGMSVGRRLRMVREALKGVDDCIHQPSLKSKVRKRLRIHVVVQITDLQQ